jgi:outer membrane beta-barrel protein
MKIILMALSLLITQMSWAGLEDDINSLQVNESIPNSVQKEKVYAIQSRKTSLSHRFELSGAWAKNLSGNGMLKTQQASGDLRFHLNDKWTLAAGYTSVTNEFNSTAQSLADVQGYLPDVDYVKSRTELRAEYNLFYGKFRLSQDSIFYFDQYIGLGAATNELASGTSTGPVGELGFAFWWGKHFSSRLAIRDYYYQEKRTLASESVHNVFGQAEIGYVF